MNARARQFAEPVPATVQVLQTQLRDLVELALQAQHVKWSLVPDAPATNTQLLADVVADAWHRADRVAEELRARDTAPDARIRTIAANPALYPTPNGWTDSRMVTGIGYALGRSATWARERAEELHREPELARLLGSIGRGLEDWANAILDAGST